MTGKKKKKPSTEVAEASKWLRSNVKPGSTIYCVLRHVSSSGMNRRISFFVIRKGVLICMDYYMAIIGVANRSKNHDGLTVSGCGMDMGFHCVYSLEMAMWPKGAKKPHGMRNGEPDSDGGYALKSQWV